MFLAEAARQGAATKKPPLCKAVLKSPVKADTTIAKLEQEAALVYMAGIPAFQQERMSRMPAFKLPLERTGAQL